MTFDQAALRGVTRSGRVHELVGMSDFDADAQYVWNRWQKFNRVQSCTDVIDEVCAGIHPLGPLETVKHG
jgi:hypothetical protein